MKDRLLEILSCPRHKLKLTLKGDHLTCPEDDRFFVFDDIPVLLFNDGRPAHGHIRSTLKQVERLESGEPVDKVIPRHPVNEHGVDDFVREQLPFTCGNLYFSVQKDLTRYPFPDDRLPVGMGRSFLDVGCSWGRWTIPASRKGFRAVGVDPHLDVVLAAKRICSQLGVDADFVVGDASYLPLRDNVFDMTFSFSVLQHLARSTVHRTLEGISRVTVPGGQVMVQMPNRYGLRSIYMQARRRFRSPNEAMGDVFYWRPDELKREFYFHFGPTELLVDSFFGLNLQSSDADLMPLSHRIVIAASRRLRHLSRLLRPIKYVADSLYVKSINNKPSSR